ncbi:MAG: oxidoreductase [Phycisphaerae bacterium]
MSMQRRPLGATGIKVSVLGLGTVKLGRTEQVKYPAPFSVPSDAEAAALLDLAAGLGITVLDTAPAYGIAEERVGRLIAADRDRWTIVTKAGEEFSEGRSQFDFSPAAIRASLERSLRRLGTDRVEVLLIHSDGAIETRVPDEVWVELARLRHEGKVRAAGISTKSVEGSRACLPHVDVLMVTVDPRDPADTAVVEEAHTRGVGVLAKKVLGSGHAADPAAALRAVIGVPGVSCAVIGTINPVHLQANCQAAGVL